MSSEVEIIPMDPGGVRRPLKARSLCYLQYPRPSCQDLGLAAYRGLSDSERRSGGAGSPLRLIGFRAAASSRGRRPTAGAARPGPGVGGEQIPPVDVWSTEALRRDFPRLSPVDFDTDGVHLHPIHYRVIRAAVEEPISAAAPLPAPVCPASGSQSHRARREATGRTGAP